MPVPVPAVSAASVPTADGVMASQTASMPTSSSAAATRSLALLSSPSRSHASVVEASTSAALQPSAAPTALTACTSTTAAAPKVVPRRRNGDALQKEAREDFDAAVVRLGVSPMELTVAAYMACHSLAADRGRLVPYQCVPRVTCHRLCSTISSVLLHALCDRYIWIVLSDLFYELLHSAP